MIVSHSKEMRRKLIDYQANQYNNPFQAVFILKIKNKYNVQQFDTLGSLYDWLICNNGQKSVLL